MAKCITCMIVHMLIEVYILHMYFIYIYIYIFLHMYITGVLYMYYKCIWVTCLIYHTVNTHVKNYLVRFISKGIKCWKLYFFPSYFAMFNWFMLHGQVCHIWSTCMVLVCVLYAFHMCNIFVSPTHVLHM